jgi:hypothetical protein
MTDDQCSSSGHYSCNSSGKCIYTSEAGVNSCLNDFDCIFQKAGLYAACSETSCILARGTGQNFCQSNADCGGGCGNTICEIGEQISCPQDCSGQLCVLTSAKWEKNTAFEGEVIDLYVNGTNCEGLIINFTIKKNGILFDDPVLTSPLNAVFANGQAKTS